MGGAQWWDEDTGPCEKPVHDVHNIFPHYTSPADDEADTSSMRHGLGSGLKDLVEERQFTDLTLEVDGKTWEVHRVVLASCSPFFKQLLQCGPAPGTQCDSCQIHSHAHHSTYVCVAWQRGRSALSTESINTECVLTAI